MKPGNRKGTNPSPPDRTGRTRRTAIVRRMPPPVLNGTGANCGPPFGTKRPQVQILSPRPGIPAGQRPAREMVRASLAPWGPPKGTLRERRCACSAARQRPGPRSGRRGRRVQILSPRPFPQVAELRECRFLRAMFHSPAIATEASWEQVECRGHRDRQKNTQPPSTTQQTTRHSRVPSGHCDPPSTTKRSSRAGRPPARNH
jgi:hypothetical protein